MFGQMHQCPLCGHTWRCNELKCEADLHDSDDRCLPERGNDKHKVFEVRSLRLDRGSTYRRPRYQGRGIVSPTPSRYFPRPSDQ